jgi:hypothetical protein
LRCLCFSTSNVRELQALFPPFTRRNLTMPDGRSGRTHVANRRHDLRSGGQSAIHRCDLGTMAPPIRHSADPGTRCADGAGRREPRYLVPREGAVAA